jgi:hypothetical protein
MESACQAHDGRLASPPGLTTHRCFVSQSAGALQSRGRLRDMDDTNDIFFRNSLRDSSRSNGLPSWQVQRHLNRYVGHSCAHLVLQALQCLLLYTFY